MKPTTDDHARSPATDPVRLDGSLGEGGGQVLRSALALSCLTGRALELTHIRAGRRKPGLMRQHLTCVRAAARASGALVRGDELGSEALVFEPAGRYAVTGRFDIGTAGATSLVLQTVLYPLLFADGVSALELTGGTHVLAAPTFTFLTTSFLPLVKRMGADVHVEIERAGYYPAGGGHIRVAIEPLTAPLAPLDLDTTATDKGMYAVATTSKIDQRVGGRELRQLAALLPIGKNQLFDRRDRDSVGPGNVLSVDVPLEDGRVEHFTACGRRGVPSEKVAADLAHEVRAFRAAGVAVGEHLADQLLLPLALAGGGSFTTTTPSLHTRTNAEVIGHFLDVSFEYEELGPDRVRVRVEGTPLVPMPGG
ncbi:RNA 3'-terminal phosphate cyclase [Planctomycetes bacterium Pla163]|uniref:RNA 3'-terminal phosphate cyclase n=1 Tax=Rohdeia mirabilis TaxID=2528008 RepID=A0A518CYH5_9BACT|nr:RNA 3'-terminal phosphate cyclase [Planctomycetes bacterium Pla163]